MPKGYVLKNGVLESTKPPRLLGERNHKWKGGRRIDGDGYVLIYAPYHPSKRKANAVLEHRLVMEKHLGRVLLRTEIVHHKDGNKQNNDLTNLELFDPIRHMLAHNLHSLGGKAMSGKPRKRLPFSADDVHQMRRDGLTYREIGERLGVQPATARARLLFSLSSPLRRP